MVTRKSRSLDDVSKSVTKNTHFERRALPRLCLSSELFRLQQNGKIFSVADLSQYGMALHLLDSEDLIHFSIGAKVNGVLNLRREKFSIQARVKNVGRERVGCEFESLDKNTSHVIQQFLDPAFLAQEMKPIPSSQSGSLWYHGPSGTDLLFVREMDGHFRRFTLYLLGSFSQWDETLGLSTGLVDSSFESSESRGVVRFETMLLDADPKPDPQKLRIAKTFVLSSNLPQELKKWCVRNLGLIS